MNRLFTPLFERPDGNVIFLPYDFMMAETKHGARKIGRTMRRDVLIDTGFNFAGRVKLLEPEGARKYPRVPAKLKRDVAGRVQKDDVELWCCPVEGPCIKQIQQFEILDELLRAQEKGEA